MRKALKMHVHLDGHKGSMRLSIVTLQQDTSTEEFMAF
jgi:hypothetical protein